MGSNLAARWRSRHQSSTFYATPALTERGLVLGHGTVLLSFQRTAGLTLAGDPGHDRRLALLAVAGKGCVRAASVEAIAIAAGQWRHGDRALAALRLAFAPLPRLASQHDAYTLFLTETALDVGLSPHEILRELGYKAVVPLLKGAVDQPRVPAGSGRASGRWTSGSDSDASTTPSVRSTSASGAPERDTGADSERPVIPVFLRPEHHGEDAIDDKPMPYRSEPLDEDVEHGHAIDPHIPRGGVLPFGSPGIADEPSPRSEDDEKDGPACPPMQDDVGHGASPAAQRWEALIAQLVNPSDPTPKQTPETPNVKSQAYFLPQPAMSGGKVSYDDCKRTNEPSPIVELRKGDMVDARNENRSFVYYYPSVRGFDDFEDQVVDQDTAVELEGKGRRVFQCVGTAKDAAHLTIAFADRVEHTVFQACHL